MLSTRRTWILAGGLALVASLGAGIGFYWYAANGLGQLMSVRLDPLGLEHHRGRNESLGPKPAGVKRVVFLGDSRIAHWRPLPPLEAAEIINRGIAGQTTAQVAGRIQQDAIDIDADLVVLQLGINDLKTIGLWPERESEIVARCEANIRAVVEALEARRIQVVVLGVFPVGPVEILRRPIWSDRVDGSVDDLNSNLKGLHGEYVEVVDAKPVLASNRGAMRDDFARDALHLTPKAYERLNGVLVPIIERRLSGEPD